MVEDNFPLGRPKWEEVGVQMVKSVVSYEKLKISVLNICQVFIESSSYLKIINVKIIGSLHPFKLEPSLLQNLL